MRNKMPDFFEAWVGGYVGPSYKVALRDGTLIYEVFKQGYELHASEKITPDLVQWGRFLHDVSTCGTWDWNPRYRGTDGADGTTWYVNLSYGSHTITSRGLNYYPPGFVDFLRAVRNLLGGRQFS